MIVIDLKYKWIERNDSQSRHEKADEKNLARSLTLGWMKCQDTVIELLIYAGICLHLFDVWLSCYVECDNRYIGRSALVIILTDPVRSICVRRKIGTGVSKWYRVMELWRTIWFLISIVRMREDVLVSVPFSTSFIRLYPSSDLSCTWYVCSFIPGRIISSSRKQNRMSKYLTG
jgi:hypothetical protein